jgi:hypothetical protein
VNDLYKENYKSLKKEMEDYRGGLGGEGEARGREEKWPKQRMLI